MVLIFILLRVLFHFFIFIFILSVNFLDFALFLVVWGVFLLFWRGVPGFLGVLGCSGVFLEVLHAGKYCAASVKRATIFFR